jgi:dTDP-4-amino-4,6-dideoxygalactose transaminase
MIGEPSLAVFGAKPRFDEPLPVGQYYWPEWAGYEKAAQGIFSRRYYTAQRFAGPLVVEFQRRLQEFLGVKHAIAVRNATNGLMILAHILGQHGKVIVPSWTFIATVQSLLWANCQPVFCDIDPETQQMSPGSVKRLLENGDVKAILGVHLWGNALPVDVLEMLAEEHGAAVYYDAAHAFGCRVGERAIGTFGRAEVFSFHAGNIVSTGEGGCITTDDDGLAAKLRAMRGDHVSGGGEAMQSATARMSEIQAAVGLMMLDAFERNRRNNEEQHKTYEERLSAVPGIRILHRSGASRSNFQSLVCVVEEPFGLTRDELLAVLRAENVEAERRFYPPTHAVSPFSNPTFQNGRLRNTETAARTTFQLPVGNRVTVVAVERICTIIRDAHVHSKAIRSVLAPPAAT